MASDKDRSTARRIQQEHQTAGRPLEWFETLYAQRDLDIVPWANLRPNPRLKEWFERRDPGIPRGTAVKVGCGLGDDAEFLQDIGFATTAFDISASAISWCRERFPDSAVRYTVCNLFKTPAEWSQAFDLVLETYTIQAMPVEFRNAAIAAVANLVAANGYLLVICRGRNEDADPGNLPWPLTESELRSFECHGLQLVTMEHLPDEEDPSVVRFRVWFNRPTANPGQ